MLAAAILKFPCLDKEELEAQIAHLDAHEKNLDDREHSIQAAISQLETEKKESEIKRLEAEATLNAFQARQRLTEVHVSIFVIDKTLHIGQV